MDLTDYTDLEEFFTLIFIRVCPSNPCRLCSTLKGILKRDKKEALKKGLASHHHKRIIGHLKLTFHAERPPPPQVVQQQLMIAAEGREEYF